MSEMVERVARALAADHYGERFRKPVDDQQVAANVDANWNIYAGQARIAIAAMREPTEAMTSAAEEEGTVVGCCNITAEPAREAWQIMIDSTLTPSPPHQG